jgi:Helix-turn-helix.|nr:MAG TPA: Cro/C1-type HTH DNA-binding domain protein [Caudoviricetes sp.]
MLYFLNTIYSIFEKGENKMLWKKISEKLSEKNWTIYKLCLEAGIGTAGIYRLRDGVIKDLQFETVRKIADALDMSLEEFR